MIIQKRLFQITFIVVLFSALLVLGLLQVAKGAKFHQLNFLHLKYVVELNAKLAEAKSYSSIDIPSFQKITFNIHAQPKACLDLINWFDRIIMKLIDTDIAIALCEQDKKSAEILLSHLDTYQKGLSSFETIYQQIALGEKEFTKNSSLFEEPIERTVEFIMTSTLISFLTLGSLMIIFIIYTTNNISKTAVSMHKTTIALRKSEQLNRKLAHIDTLTGLPNRNLFLNRLNHLHNLSERKNSNFALLFIDLDRFKNVNDSLGHQAGDELIIEAGKRLVQCIRKSDTVARIGGDEFNIILSDVSHPENASLIAKKVVQRLAEPFRIREQDIYISASVGIASYPNDAENTDDLQKFADLAMYQAKSKGRNNFEFYSSQLDKIITHKSKLEQHLRCALERNEFYLNYQPVIRLSDQQIVGVEALIRWKNPTLGLVLPNEFIPLAEETGLIVDIGNWVLQESCKTAKIWLDESHSNFKVAINVSPKQLRSKKFTSSVKLALVMSELPASALDIEITESSLVKEDQNSLNTLNELSELGVRLLLDDFGTGHSSFSYLHTLPFNVLKIDRSFILSLENTPNMKNIVSSIIAMAHELKLEVITEGVETLEAQNLLTELGCEFAQGYFFSPPVPANEINVNKTYSNLVAN